MANLKNIADLPVAESVENLNLIVNENGSAKQIASSAVGAQADFAVTDETSPAFIKNKPEVAQSDWSVEDSSNPAFIKNKPFYDTREFETITVTFNGDLAEKEFVQADDVSGFIKLSDKIPSKEELIGGILKITAPDGVHTLEITEKMVMMQDGVIAVVTDDGVPALIIIPQELIIDDVPFTSAGVWAICGLADGAPVFYVSELSQNSVTSGELKTIEPKYVKDMYYSTQFNNVEILAETTQIPDEEGYISLQEPMELLVENGMYTVNWNGVEYLCQCFKAGEVLTLESEPFAIGYHPDMSMEGLSAMIHVFDGSTSVTLSIVGSYEEVKKIDMKYMPYEVQDSINKIHNIVDDVRNVANKMDKTNPVGTGSFSMNRKSGTTIGDYSHAEGQETTASGKWSHAEGGYTTASGNCSHAEGGSTSAFGDNSHAEGYSTNAYGLRSHAEGEQTFAQGDYSHVEGSHTTATRAYQHVQGKYNIVETGDAKQQGLYAHIVGNGTPSQRSNAHTLDWEGNAWFAGSVEGNAIILPSSTEGSTKRFRITVDDSGVLTATEIVVSAPL